MSAEFGSKCICSGFFLRRLLGCSVNRLLEIQEIRRPAFMMSLPPRQNVSVARAPGELDASATAQVLVRIARNSCAQRMLARVADQQNGVAVIDDVTNEHFELSQPVPST